MMSHVSYLHDLSRIVLVFGVRKEINDVRDKVI